jgi:hypothetical protein
MAVYVGEQCSTVRTPRWPYKYAAHLFADSLDELHRFALSIGLRRDWFQDHPRLRHYDVTAGKRREAIQKGAVAVPPQTEVAFMRAKEDNRK